MKGFIYKIYCKDTNITECYIGSTNNFGNRKRNHKYRYNNTNKYKVYEFIRKNGGYNNWDFEIIKEVEYDDKYQLKEVERSYIETLKAELNTYIPNRILKDTKIAYRAKPATIIKEREYAENYKHIREERSKQKVTCECGSIVRRDTLLRHKKSIKHNKNLKVKK